MVRKNTALVELIEYPTNANSSLRYDYYWKAINHAVKKGDVVADLGSESGILTFFALKAGAKKVYAIYDSNYQEIQNIIDDLTDNSAEVVLINHQSLDRIKEPLDVMLSGTKGSLGFDEQSLNKIIEIRDKHLKVDGILIPEDITLWLSPAESKAHCNRNIVWSDIHGFEFSDSEQQASKKVLSQTIAKQSLLAKPQVFANIDFYTETRSVINKKINFKIFREGVMNGFAGWYQVNLYDGTSYSTSPENPLSLGKQSFLPLANDVTIFKHQSFGAEFTIEPTPPNSRVCQTSFVLFNDSSKQNFNTSDKF